jgi:hypothetical protein
VNRDVMAERLRGVVRPLADKLVDQVVELIAKQAETSWAAASKAAIDKLREQLEGKHDEEHDAGPRRGRVDRQKARRHRRARGRARDTREPARAGGRDRQRAEEGARAVEEAPAAEPVKQPRKCRLCRQPGHRADRCPNAEQTPASAEQAAPSLNTRPQTSSPPPSKLDRFARIEAAARARREGLAG